ncbi:MAG TPA: hypothetical protein VNF24_04460, partial [Candidatus Acidoferrales bacterium]|nr:hypothetical protein [Candidatus Acidoferrales bacterium]
MIREQQRRGYGAWLLTITQCISLTAEVSLSASSPSARTVIVEPLRTVAAGADAEQEAPNLDAVLKLIIV